MSLPHPKSLILKRFQTQVPTFDQATNTEKQN
jgi:hypothetical protein